MFQPFDLVSFGYGKINGKQYETNRTIFLVERFQIRTEKNIQAWKAVLLNDSNGYYIEPANNTFYLDAADKATKILSRG